MTTTTYRAAFFLADNGASTVLTTEAHASLSDDALRAEALAEADRARLIGDDTEAGQVTYAAFFDGLRIGNWTE